MQFDAERVRANVRQATTEDLLDRLTVYQEGMEPEALAIIAAEARRRGVTADDMAEHADRYRQQSSLETDGPAPKCSFCERPAIEWRWNWQRLWGKLPVFPRRFFYCAEHAQRDD